MSAQVNNEKAKFPSKAKEAQLSFNTNVLLESSSSKFVPQKCEIQVVKSADMSLIAKTQLNLALHVNTKEPNFILALDMVNQEQAEEWTQNELDRSGHSANAGQSKITLLA